MRLGAWLLGGQRERLIGGLPGQWRFGDQRQTGNALEMPTVVRDQLQIVTDGARGNPAVIYGNDPVSAGLGLQAGETATPSICTWNTGSSSVCSDAFDRRASFTTICRERASACPMTRWRA